MITVYYDSGTTNSRIFLLKDGCVLHSEKVKIGCKDAALAGDPGVLVQALYGLYINALSACTLQDSDVNAIYLSGMATTPSGLMEVEHLSTPAGAQELRENIALYEENTCFHRTFHLIPGLKTAPRGVRVSPQEAALVNNVRGEETEVLGILRQTGLTNAAILLPGSHTQTAIVENGRVVDLLSTVTGELYDAVVNRSIIGSSVGEGNTDPAWVKQGAEALQTHGFNRALYITRSLELFADTTPLQRKSFLEGVINGGTVQELLHVLQRYPAIRNVIVYGGAEQHAVLAAIAEAYGAPMAFTHLPPDPNCPMAVYGVMALTETE